MSRGPAYVEVERTLLAAPPGAVLSWPAPPAPLAARIVVTPGGWYDLLLYSRRGEPGRALRSLTASCAAELVARRLWFAPPPEPAVARPAGATGFPPPATRGGGPGLPFPGGRRAS